MGVVIATATILFVLMLAISVWRTWLNPVLLAPIAWAPAIVFSSLDVEFTMPFYRVLNRGMDVSTYLCIAVAFVSYTIGAIAIRSLPVKSAGRSLPKTYSCVPARTDMLALFFLVGLAVFVYAFRQSGLGEQLTAERTEVYESRLAFHVGFVNHFLLLMDVTAVIFFAKFLETSRIRFALPMVLGLLCYLATLQKSRVLFRVLSAAFIAFIYKEEAKRIFLGTRTRGLMTGLAVVFLLIALALTNLIRGIGIARYTDLESPLVEQLFIYSGAPALLNLSATMAGVIPSDPPSLGAIMLRPFLWDFVDRDLLNPTRYLGGINNGTSLIFYWQDFRLLGIVLIPFFVGAIVSVFIALAQRRSPFGLVAGAMGFYAIVLSVYTDVVFEPTTAITLALAAVVDMVSRRRPERVC